MTNIGLASLKTLREMLPVKKSMIESAEWMSISVSQILVAKNGTRVRTSTYESSKTLPSSSRKLPVAWGRGSIISTSTAGVVYHFPSVMIWNLKCLYHRGVVLASCKMYLRTGNPKSIRAIANGPSSRSFRNPSRFSDQRSTNTSSCFFFFCGE